MTTDDEAYARELQAQFEREAANALNNANNNSNNNSDNRRRGRRGRGRRSRDNNNHGDRSTPSSVDAPSSHSTTTASAPNTTARASAPPAPETDEEMARRLQQEMKDKEHTKRSHRKERAARSRARSPAPRPSAPPAEQVLEESRGSSEPPQKTQEEKDAELAKRIHRKEKAKARAAAAAAKEGDDREKTGLVATNPSPPDASAAAGATQEEKDAELARLLQRKEKERAKGNGRSGRRSPTAPSAGNHHDKAKQQEEEDERLARKINHAEQARARRHHHHHKEESKEEEEKKEETPVTDNDEELARRLEQELRDEELARRLNEKESRRRRRTSLVARRNKAQQKRNQSQSPLRPTVDTDSPPEVTTGTEATLESSNGSGGAAVGTGRSKSPVRHKKPARERLYPDYPEQYPEQAPDFDEYEDMEMARRVEQEEKDAALARQLSQHEMRRLSVYRVADNVVERRRPWTCKRIMTLSLPLLLILGAVVGLAFVFGGRGGLPRLPGTPPVFRDDDPFEGINPEDANRWQNTDGKGLYLEVLNALQSDWEESFNVAISEWDFGNPDALSLTTTRVAVDPDCRPRDDVMKVCNGDYGENRWRGINQVMISNGYIINSIAKLNEFYLRDADEAQRQYTMCHEIGHGFGLPHTDEDFFNADLGNCMDYTSNPAVNKSPDQSNYLFLFDLYGLVQTRGDQNRLLSEETQGDAQRGQSNPAVNKSPEKSSYQFLFDLYALMETWGSGQRRRLTQMTPELLERYNTAVREVANADDFHLEKTTFPAKLMHHDEHSEMVAVSLGDGVVLEFHKLLAEPTLTPTRSPATTTQP